MLERFAGNTNFVLQNTFGQTWACPGKSVIRLTRLDRQNNLSVLINFDHACLSIILRTMDCLQGKAYSQFSLLEGIYANAVAFEVHRLCVESCCGCRVNHPSQRQHDCLMMDECERWEMYGLQAVEQVIANGIVWQEFVEVTRVLGLEVEQNIFEHLKQTEKDPDPTFIHSLMKIQNTENRELQCILNYLWYWREKDPLESVAETFFSNPATYVYTIKMTGERFRSHERDRKKTFQDYIVKKLFEQFNE